MAHFDRGKCKRRVRCTMCTSVRWRGNNNASGRSQKRMLRGSRARRNQAGWE